MPCADLGVEVRVCIMTTYHTRNILCLSFTSSSFSSSSSSFFSFSSSSLSFSSSFSSFSSSGSDDEVEIWIGEACVPLSLVVPQQQEVWHGTCEKRINMPIEPKVCQPLTAI